jgi:hypothetical protein
VKVIAVCVGLLSALSVNAQGAINAEGAAIAQGAVIPEGAVRAKLVSQRVVASFPGTPILICRYSGPGAAYEVVASAETCAPYLTLS